MCSKEGSGKRWPGPGAWRFRFQFQAHLHLAGPCVVDFALRAPHGGFRIETTVGYKGESWPGKRASNIYETGIIDQSP